MPLKEAPAGNLTEPRPSRFLQFSKRSVVDIAAGVFCLVAAIYLLCGPLAHVRDVWVDASVLPPLDPAAPAIFGTGFATDPAELAAQPRPVNGNLKLYGSHLGSDASTGSITTGWFKAVPHFSILVTGFPAHPGNQLLIEVETRNAGTIRLPAARYQDPGDIWRPEEVSLPQSAGPTRFRIVAIDRATDFLGWFGFSQPYIPRVVRAWELPKQLALVILTTVTAFVAFFAPGLILRRKLRSSSARRLPFIWIPVPGLILLAVLGLLAWKGPHQLSGVAISRIGLWLLVLYSCYHFVRYPLSAITTAFERRVLIIAIVLAAICVAKATYSIGPRGELYGGKISRTLEVGDRSDSRVPYHVVQLVAARKGAFSGLAFSLFSPFNFSHRGPIASLAVSPIVLAGPVRVLPQMPDQPWTVFDAEGFSAYRISMVVLACASLLSVFGLASLFLAEEWAFFAFLVTVTTPFIIHEIYFTWPKLEAASFVLLAAYCIFRSRYFAAGFSVGIGYLCHPSALMWMPALLAVLVLWSPRNSTPWKKIFTWVSEAALLSAGVGFWLLFWKIVNRGMYEQAGFLNYFKQPGPPLWLQWRLDSLANTLIPLNLYAFHRASPFVNSVIGPSPEIVRFFFQYWNTLPFGIGIAFFFCVLRVLYSAWKHARAWLLWVVVVPLAFFTVYWGAANTGLMREGLHAWVLGLLIFVVIVWRKYLKQANRFASICSWILLFRGAEVLAMLLLPSVLSRHQLVQRVFVLSDILALSIMGIGTIWLSYVTFSVAQAIAVRRPDVA